LTGEFLGRPLTTSDVGFTCLTMNTESSEAYESFFNVGIWRDLASLKEEIIEPYADDNRKTEPFEYQYRERMVLEPHSIRVVDFELPENDNFT
jgi:hypothetical protein